MKPLKLSQNNKTYIVHRYVDHIVSRMDNDDMWNAFKDYLFREKMGYPIDTLEIEIKRHCPQILEDNIAEEVVGKGAEYATTV